MATFTNLSCCLVVFVLLPVLYFFFGTTEGEPVCTDADPSRCFVPIKAAMDWDEANSYCKVRGERRCQSASAPARPPHNLLDLQNPTSSPSLAPSVRGCTTTRSCRDGAD